MGPPGERKEGRVGPVGKALGRPPALGWPKDGLELGRAAGLVAEAEGADGLNALEEEEGRLPKLPLPLGRLAAETTSAAVARSVDDSSE